MGVPPGWGRLVAVRSSAPRGAGVGRPPGWSLLVALRSSAPRRHGVIQPHGVGIIDQDYRGPEDELRIQLLNVGRETVEIPAGTRLAQGVLLKSDQASFVARVPEGLS